jgi:hypothetical protein
MPLNKLAREFLFILFVLYYAQDWLYTSGSLFSQICIIIIILISGVYMVKSLLLKDRKNMFFNAWTIFIILNLTGLIFKPDLSEGPVRDAIKNTLGCMLPFYPFYYFAKKEELKTIHLIRFALLILPIIIFRYFTNKSDVLLIQNPDNTDVVNNFSYMFVSILPYIFLIKKRRLIAVLLMLLIIMFVIQGAKRGAIIAASIGLLMYFYYQIKTIENKRRILGFISVIIVIMILSVFAYITSMSNDFMLNRMTSMVEGDTSNRSILYAMIFEKWYASDNILNLLFGYGLAGSLVLTDGWGLAHNDWLELLSNFGLTGIFTYIFLFYSAVKTSLTKEWMSDKRILMLTLVFMWFFITLVSMWYNALEYFANAILFGYLVGNKNLNLE